MESFATTLAQNPQTALTIVAVFLALFFAWLLFQSFKSKIDGFEKTAESSATQMQVAQTSFQGKLNETRAMIFKHSEDMGKMTKAVQGDFLKVQEKLFNLRQELVSELEKVKSLSSETTRSLTMAQELTKLSIEGMNEKLGKIIYIEKEIEVIKRQFPNVQESVGQNRIAVERNTQQVGELAKHLANTKHKLQQLELEIKKGAKNEI